MAFIAAPDFGIKSISWSPNTSAQINVGAYNGVRTLSANPWFTQWTAQVDLAQTQGESGFRLLRSFFMRTLGSINTFRLHATPEIQNSNFGVTVASNASQGATSMTLAGYTTPLTEGQFLTVNGQLLCCTADQSGSTVNFQPALRTAATAGTPVVTSRPYALVYLTSPQRTWSEGNWRLFDASFQVAEAINGTDGVTIPETQLVTNGTFGTDTSGWTASNATLSVVSGRMRVTNTGTVSGTASQIIAVIPGKSYILKWDAVAGTSTNLEMLVVDGANTVFTSTVVGTGQSTTITPKSATLTLDCFSIDTVVGRYADFDNISLVEA